jgi:hypothetical protein
MKPIIFFLFLSALVITGCKDQKEKADGEVTAEPQTPVVVQDFAKDSAEIRKVITDFYKWYTANDTKLQGYDLYSSIKRKSLPPYKMNWEQVEKYQAFIRSSVPQLGETFLRNQKRFFEQCDSAFKVNVDDDIPYGFDYDWYTNSQEDPQYLLDEINKSKPWSMTLAAEDATVSVKGEYDNNGKPEETTFITLAMKKENGQWKIAKIGND